MSLVFCAVISFLTSTAPPMVSASDVAPHVATLTQEVRYKSPEVGEVLLVWGIDGWNPLPESLRPLGTTVDKSVMHTPMNKQGEWFVVTIRVPSDSTVDFGFKITKSLGGSDLNIWDGNGKEGYRAVAKGHDTIEVISHVSLSTSGRWSIQDASSSWGYLVAAASGTLFIIAIGAIALSRHRRMIEKPEARPFFYHRGLPARKAELLLLSMSLIVAIGIGEYVLRLVAPHGGFGAARELDWMRSNPGKLSRLYAIDQELGFRPNLTSGFYSEYGTRRNAYTIDKRPGVTRLLFFLACLLLGCISPARTREAQCFGSLMVDVWNSQQEIESLEEAWRAALQVRHDLSPDPRGSALLSSLAGDAGTLLVPVTATLRHGKTDDRSKNLSETDELYRTLTKMRARHKETSPGLLAAD